MTLRSTELHNEEVDSIRAGLAILANMRGARYLTADQHAKRVGRILVKARELEIAEWEITLPGRLARETARLCGF